MDITLNYNLGLRPYYSVSGSWLSYDSAWNARDINGMSYAGGEPIMGFDSDGRCVEAIGSGAEQLVDTSISQATAVAGWADDVAINTVAGGVTLADKGFSLAAQAMGGDSNGFDQDAQKWGSYMSPYANAGYYDANNPGVQIATAATIFANPESAAGSIESSIVRDFGEANVITDPARMLPAPQQPAGLLADTTGGSSAAFDYYMNQAKSLDVSTANNGAVFWSGSGNRQLAEQCAEQNGKYTLEKTAGGNWLDQQQLFANGSPLSQDQARAVWGVISQRFAQQASGTTVGFVQGASARSVFNTVEYPTLLNNSSIMNIITGGF
jgi:hypothetical protein